MHFITATQIEQLTDFPALVEVLKKAFRSDLVTPQRHHHEVENPGATASSTLLLMPAWKPGQSLGVKVVNVFPENGKLGLPSIHGLYVLADGRTGVPWAILDGAALTVKRTAATSALASSFLSKENSETLLMIGTGALAPNFIRAHAAVRPIRQVFVWGRDVEKAKRLAGGFQNEKFNVQAVADIGVAIGEADIVSCATLSPAPLVFGKNLKPGQHLDLVGAYKKNMREADDEAIRRASVFLDTYEGGLHESGDITQPIESGILKPSAIKADLPELCKNLKPGRTSAEEITLFKSVGHASEDLAAAEYYFSKTVEEK